MPTFWPRTIGIAGGLGPYAHVAFERCLLEAAAHHIGPQAKDQDFPPWVLSSHPATPDRTDALLHGGESPVPAIVESIERLRDADFAVIPCNTAHAYLDEIRDASAIPVMDMVGATVRTAAAMGGPVGLLATDGTLAAKVFELRGDAAGATIEIRSLLDFDDGADVQERLIMTPIYGPLRNGERAGGGIKSGALEGAEREACTAPILRAIELLAEAGAQRVILGCTELPLAIDGAETAAPCLDPMYVAAEIAVAYAAGDDTHAWAFGASGA